MRFSFVIIFIPLFNFAQVNYSLGEKDFTVEIEESSSFTIYNKSNFKLKDSIVDLAYLMPPAGDQGTKGSCWAWATTYAIRSVLDNNPPYTLSDNSLDKSLVYSPEYVYQYYKGSKKDCNWGAYSYEMLKKILTDGAVKYEDFEYLEKSCNIQPNSELVSKAKQFSKPDFTVELLNDLYSIQKILAQKQPLVISIRVDDYFCKKGNINSNSPFWNEYHTRNGNHAMVVVGYDNHKKALKVLNSWGKEFGKDGYVWISYSIINSSMNYACYPKKDESKYVDVIPVRDPESQQNTSHWPNQIENFLKSWFKKGYFVNYENFRIGLAGLNNNKKIAFIEITTQTGELKTSFYLEEKTSKEFFIDGKKYNFNFEDISSVGFNPFKKGVFFSIENIAVSSK